MRKVKGAINEMLPKFLGRSGLARFLGISDARVGQISPAPDAFLDGRPVWLLETAERLRAEREAKRHAKKATSSERAGRVAV